MQVLMALLYTASILLIIYSLLINLYLHRFRKLKYFLTDITHTPITKFSIIIPSRNEAANIEACIQSIYKNNYPENLFEVIIADDFSDDDSPIIISSLQKKYGNLHCIYMKDVLTEKINSYKKKAIETAIAKASYSWIITTDADCLVPVKWLFLFDEFIQYNNPVFVAAPVMFHHDKTLLSTFQCLDFISLQGITAASVAAGFHSMCNGANLAYRKDVFFKVNGFAGVDNIASGDDMLLMHKIKEQYPEQVDYLFHKGAIVKTMAMATWKDFFNQRIRWASKSTSYSDKKVFMVLLLVYFTNLSIALLLPAALYDYHFFFYWLVLTVLKGLAEMPFMYAASSFFGLQSLLKWFIPVQPLHNFYIVLSGFLGKFGSYEWKGRKVK